MQELAREVASRFGALAIAVPRELRIGTRGIEGVATRMIGRDLELDSVPGPVAGVFCYDEGLVHQAATVAAALGLPGSPPEAVAACRDKNATRSALALAGVPQPVSIGVHDLAEAAAAADKIGYPVVVKPRGLAGSMGVTLVHAPDELAEVEAGARGPLTWSALDAVLSATHLDRTA